MRHNLSLYHILFAMMFTAMASATLVTRAAADDALPPSDTPSDAPAADSGGGDTAATDPSASTAAGAQVAVVDDQGKREPLASRKAARMLSTGDPIWCPSGVTPGGAGCTSNYLTFALLLADPIFSGVGPAVNGVIWIRDNYAGADAAPISINGGTLTTMKNFTLTLKGGWTGVGTTINTLTPSVFDEPLSIVGWNANVTLSDIELSGVGGTGGAFASALYIGTNKSISLNRVNVHDSTSGTRGAFLDNTAGTGSVTVSASRFSQNAGSSTGLVISSKGAVTLTGITANGNASWGAGIDNCQVTGSSCSGSGAATLSGTNIFSGNAGGGLSVTSGGAIKANNVVANSNPNGSGAYFTNAEAILAQPVTLTGSSQFKYNKNNGLNVASKGLVILYNVTASGSLLSDGAYIDNCQWDVGLAVCRGSGNVVLTGTNLFQDNAHDGLHIMSGGVISVNNVNANWNGISFGTGWGAELNNCAWDLATATCTRFKPVTLTGTNVFNGNKSSGLAVDSGGAIKANNLTASNSVLGAGASFYNGYTGAVGGVTLTGVNAFNDNKKGYGLSIYSFGAVSLANVTAQGNGVTISGGGVTITNSGSGSGKPVTLGGTNNLSGNQNAGLSISSSGVIRINNLTASDSLSSVGADLFTNYSSTLTLSVVLTGTNRFERNSQEGLYVLSNGIVALNNVNANQNHATGVYLDNTSIASPRNVILTGLNVFTENDNTGLEIQSWGAVSVSSIKALKNGLVDTNGYGVLINNAWGTVPKGVTVGGASVLNGNYSGGLSVFSLGTIAASNLTASDNLNGSGAHLVNAFSGVGGVTVSGTNTFERNKQGFGLYVNSNGAIVTYSLHANDNGVAGLPNGVYLNNAGAPSGTPGVKLIGTNVFNGNYGSGLMVSSLGTIQASNLSASNSQHAYGAELYNDYGSAKPGITLTGINLFTENWFSGLEAASFGPISLLTTSIIADQNGKSLSSGYGVHLDNCQWGGSACTVTAGVTLSGVNQFNGNYQTGLEVFSGGAIAVSKVTANGNTHGSGAHLNNSGGSGGGVKVTGVNNFDSNYSTGLSVQSTGAITISSLTANGNGTGGFGEGVNLDNDTPFSGNPGITLTGVNVFNWNHDNGLTVFSLGPISLQNARASNSVAGYGAALGNTGGGAVGGVKLTGTNVFNDNGLGGLSVSTLGAISANNLSASHNTGSGASFTNNFGGGAGGLTLTGINTFDNNTVYGLFINVVGNISLTKVTADHNGSDGLHATTVSGSINLMCGSFTNNTGRGLYLDSGISILLTGVVSAGNGSTDAFGVVPTIVPNCPLP